MNWLRGDHTAIGVVALVVLIVALIWLALRRPRPTPYGGNPNPTNISDEMWWLWQQLQALEPSSQLGGIYANKPGYHNARQNLPSYDYSVCDQPPDGGGPANKACAIDWTFPEAHSGNYTKISKYTTRLINSGKDPDDPRLNGWRECYGNADTDTYVEGWDFRYGCAATSDSSHLWHIHISENRDMSTNKPNKEALLSVLKGETTEQWFNRGKTAMEGDGAVLLNCPYDKTRLDLFYIGPGGTLMHRWWNGTISTAWSTNTKNENLGGSLHVGTLTAAWAPDQNSVNVAGLGAGDAKCPPDCGQYWAMNLNKSGARSGWGSWEGAYGKLPAAATPAPPLTRDVEGEHPEEVNEPRSKLMVALAAIAVVIAVVALVTALTA